MHDPYARTMAAHPRGTAAAYSFDGLGLSLPLGLSQPASTATLPTARQPAGGAVTPTPFGGQVARSSLHELPRGYAMKGRAVQAQSQPPTAPQIPMPSPSPYSNAGGQSQAQQQWVSQNVSTPVNVTVTTQPQLSATFTGQPVSQDLGPTVPLDVAAGISAGASRKCLLWLLAGGALALMAKSRS